MLRPIAIAALCLAASAAVAHGAAIRAGFDSASLGPSDDGSTGAVALGFSVDLLGDTYDRIYVNNNGNLTFDGAYGMYAPTPLGRIGQSIIAPFLADVDTANGIGGVVTYGTGSVNGHAAFAANWRDVTYYNNDDHPGQLNSFQVVLVARSDLGLGNFDIEFNYDRILWEAGTASGANAMGLGGSAARAGFALFGPSGEHISELAGSGRTGAFLDGGSHALAEHSNVGVSGRYLFGIRSAPQTRGTSVRVSPVPLPANAPLLLAALGCLALIARQRRAH